VCPSANESGLSWRWPCSDVWTVWSHCSLVNDCASLVCSQQTAPEVCWYLDTWHPHNKDCAWHHSIQCESLELAVCQHLGWFYWYCCDVCQTLKELITLSSRVSRPRTFYFARYKCPNYYTHQCCCHLLQQRHSPQRRARANTPAAWYWLRPVLGDSGRKD